MKRDFHYELYVRAWSRRDQLTAALSLPIGLVALLGGGTLSLVAKYALEWNPMGGLFLALIMGAAISLVIASYQLVKSYHGYSYLHIPDSGELQQHYVNCHEFYEDHPDVEGLPQEDFDSYLINRLKEASDHNQVGNTKKAAHLHKSVNAIIVAAWFALVSAIPVIIQNLPDLPF